MIGFVVMGGFFLFSGQKISVGLDVLQDLVKSGRYKVSAACVNTIAAYGMYTGADGQKGACKDMIDLDRYAVLSGILEATEDMGETESGRARSPSAPQQKRRIAAGGRRR